MKDLDNPLGYNSHIDDDEIKNGFLIMNIINGGDEFSEEDIELDELDILMMEEFGQYEDVYENCNDCENCASCYFSDGKYCFLKNININKYSPLCWGYRDALTMRASDSFQDDDYDLD